MLGAVVRRRPGLTTLPVRLLGPLADRQVLAQAGTARLLSDGFREGVRQGAAGHARELILLGRPWGFDLASIDVPVVIWHGSVDGVVPLAFARHLAERIPGAELRVVPGEGHFSLPIRHMRAILSSFAASSR